VARRKYKKNKLLFGRSWLSMKNQHGENWFVASLLKLSKIFFILTFFAAIGFALYHLDKKYIRPELSHETVPLRLKKVPDWVSDELKEKILEQAGGRYLRLDENAASIVRENLKSAAWLENVSVQTTKEEIQIYADYRMPVAVIKSSLSEFYIDANQIVLDYVPMPKLTLVEIKNVTSGTQEPRYGQPWEHDDLTAAIEIISKIGQMDKSMKLKKPLLNEISAIDVGNFHGRKNKSQPHIVLYSRDNTPIHWGAAIGEWQKYLESPDKQKLAKLFNYYNTEGTLNGGSKINYIDLCNPLDKIPLPIDQF
jgi:hypothetical protein